MFPKKNRPMIANGDRVLKDAFKDVGKYIELPARRAFLQRSMTLGGLSLLTGCATWRCCVSCRTRQAGSRSLFP